jgi:hypothetical protein
MRSTRLAFSLVLGVGLGYAVQVSGAPQAGSWESLFNERNLDGWVPVHSGSFEVKDRTLRCGKGKGWLRSEQEFGSFVLEFDWRGCKPTFGGAFLLRASGQKEPWPTDAWQISLGHVAAGTLRRGTEVIASAPSVAVTTNQWVKFRIEARGTRVSLDIDGRRAWESGNLDVWRGYLGIQVANGSLEFRRIRMQEIKERKGVSP